MFTSSAEKRRIYYTAKHIAETIDIQIDEIKDLDGHFTVDVSYIALDEKKRVITIDTEYINADDGKRYSMHEEVDGQAGTYRQFAKVFYMWLTTYACTFEHGVEFSGNV